MAVFYTGTDSARLKISVPGSNNLTLKLRSAMDLLAEAKIPAQGKTMAIYGLITVPYASAEDAVSLLSKAGIQASLS
jgi:hypothetical protein